MLLPVNPMSKAVHVAVIDLYPIGVIVAGSLGAASAQATERTRST
ncbi:hypothetical protein yberc0001_18250 [Yersinia bercovieri ATCC 43970]|uniref:Uncharacterized protein n=1 Tax=Yersinia bercovieri ATCC 43970 TaxID=349968 RepID=A0ABM9XW39_YERBE|nr:hypothetical protein yberc0001_18250 [Yersinia bercovieri ATCC 43970]